MFTYYKRVLTYIRADHCNAFSLNDLCGHALVQEPLPLGAKGGVLIA